MKKWKRATALFILPAFFLQGCGYWMVDRGTVRAEKPYEIIRSEAQRAAAPYETSEPKLVKKETGRETVQESFTPAHWEVVDFNGIPPGSYPYPIFDADPVWKTDKSRPNTFKAVEDYARQNGYAILKNEVDFPAKMTSGKRRTAESAKIYLIPKGKYIVYKPEEMANGDIILTPIEVPSCRNQLVWAPKLKWVPRTKIITKLRVDKEVWSATERYLDTRTVTERYRDVNTQIDAGAVALGVLGGLAAGIGFGYLFWYGSSAVASSSVVINSVCPSGVCAPGFPAPRPLP